MQPRKLGNSDVLVSPVIFGAWAIGGWMWGGTDEPDAVAAIRASLDAGVNTIDTAAIYGQGLSEELTAKALQGTPRDKVVIATKCGRRWDSDFGSDPWETTDLHGNPVTVRSDSRPESIAYECEQSLKRLRTDYIDLFQIHWPDRITPIEDSMAALARLQSQGKIRAIGVSNFEVDRMAKAIAAGPLASTQPPYSIINRGIEADVLPWCRQNNVSVIVYSPMERGLLTGKVTPDRTFPPDDHRSTHKFFTTENRRRVLDSLAQIKPICDKYNASYAQVIVNWTIHQPGITAALVGARNADQAHHNAGALAFALTPDELRQIRSAFDGTSRGLTGK